MKHVHEWREKLMILNGLIIIGIIMSGMFFNLPKTPFIRGLLFTLIMVHIWWVGELVVIYRQRIRTLIKILGGKDSEKLWIAPEVYQHNCSVCGENRYLDVFQQFHLEKTVMFFTIHHPEAPVFERDGLYIAGCGKCGSRTMVYLKRKHAADAWLKGRLIIGDKKLKETDRCQNHRCG